MEYLVTMTTAVPGGTTEAEVEEVRAREAARSRELAAQGSLLRLWRPPLRPGEWRTLGLFAADDDAGLELVLASMPLRPWRSDAVTPLAPHPNDPHRVDRGHGPEFLTWFVVTVPAGVPAATVATAGAGEARRTRELADQGHLARLWMLPSADRSWRALGLWRAPSATELAAVLASLPLAGWMATETTPLAPHPNDPAR